MLTRKQRKANRSKHFLQSFVYKLFFSFDSNVQSNQLLGLDVEIKLQVNDQI